AETPAEFGSPGAAKWSSTVVDSCGASDLPTGLRWSVDASGCRGDDACDFAEHPWRTEKGCTSKGLCPAYALLRRSRGRAAMVRRPSPSAARTRTGFILCAPATSADARASDLTAQMSRGFDDSRRRPERPPERIDPPKPIERPREPARPPDPITIPKG